MRNFTLHYCSKYFSLKALAAFLFLCLATNPGNTQNVAGPSITIGGTVISEDGEEPLVGVNVVQKGTQNGAVTDIDGNYSIMAPSDAILVFSYIGYEPQEVAVENNSTTLFPVPIDLLEGIRKFNSEPGELPLPKVKVEGADV